MLSIFAEFEREIIRERILAGQSRARAQGGGFAIDAALEINGEWQAKQTISGETDPNSGGNVIYLSPGVRLSSNAWSGFVSVGLPIVNDLNGQQSEAEYRLIGGGSLSF